MRSFILPAFVFLSLTTASRILFPLSGRQYGECPSDTLACGDTCTELTDECCDGELSYCDTLTSFCCSDGNGGQTCCANLPAGGSETTIAGATSAYTASPSTDGYDPYYGASPTSDDYEPYYASSTSDGYDPYYGSSPTTANSGPFYAETTTAPFGPSSTEPTVTGNLGAVAATTSSKSGEQMLSHNTGTVLALLLSIVGLLH